MATNKKTSTKKQAAPQGDKELEEFIHHLAEVMRFAANSDLISTRFYNSLADAWNDYVSFGELNDDNFWHSEAYIRLVLQVKQQQAQTKGGAS